MTLWSRPWSKLGEFRGRSRFTTWAYKFGVVEAGKRVRCRAWQGRDVPLGFDWPRFADDHPMPQDEAEAGERTGELFAAIQEAIEHDLSRHQREVLIATTLNDVPIDVLAERLGSTRGTLYKTIRDARRGLRVALAARGFAIDESVEASNP